MNTTIYKCKKYLKTLVYLEGSISLLGFLFWILRSPRYPSWRRRRVVLLPLFIILLVLLLLLLLLLVLLLFLLLPILSNSAPCWTSSSAGKWTRSAASGSSGICAGSLLLITAGLGALTLTLRSLNLNTNRLKQKQQKIFCKNISWIQR
jgi:hypothetical protein